jgi:hypothetical protein
VDQQNWPCAVDRKAVRKEAKEHRDLPVGKKGGTAVY